MELAIETRGLTRRFGRRVAVDALNLSVPRASVYGFLGQNGAGKTTGIRLILGLLRPHAGSVRIFGTDIADRMRASAGVGSLVETPSLYDRLTGAENLALTRRLLGAPKTEIGRVLEIVDLVSAADRLVGGYSLGMRQRLGVARALIGRPRLLVLDEPGNGLDPDGIRDTRRLLRDLAARDGVTVFVSSHLLSEVEQIATHVGLMHAGRLLVESELGALMQASRRRVLVGVADATGAVAMLCTAGLEARCTAADALSVGFDANGDDAAARINGLLTQAGFAVLRLMVEQPTLESIYLDRIGAETAQHRDAA